MLKALLLTISILGLQFNSSQAEESPDVCSPQGIVQLKREGWSIDEIRSLCRDSNSPNSSMNSNSNRNVPFIPKQQIILGGETQGELFSDHFGRLSFMSIVQKYLSVILKGVVDSPLGLLKIITPILLLVSFLSVLFGWYELKQSESLAMPLKSVLIVPLMLFGVMAIMNVMLFVEAGPSMFLAIFFIGTVIAGTEIAEKGALIAASTVSDTAGKYAETLGGIGSPAYLNGSGGVESRTIEIEQDSEEIETTSPSSE